MYKHTICSINIAYISIPCAVYIHIYLSHLLHNLLSFSRNLLLAAKKRKRCVKNSLKNLWKLFLINSHLFFVIFVIVFCFFFFCFFKITLWLLLLAFTQNLPPWQPFRLAFFLDLPNVIDPNWENLHENTKRKSRKNETNS